VRLLNPARLLPAGEEVPAELVPLSAWKHRLAGIVRHADGTTSIEAGDAFIFGPDQPHQLSNDGSEDIILYIVADNPIDESCYYPDSKKWLLCSPERRHIRSDPLDYFDGEE
jgi:uncharacterized cupin superfamily protein